MAPLSPLSEGEARGGDAREAQTGPNTQAEETNVSPQTNMVPGVETQAETDASRPHGPLKTTGDQGENFSGPIPTQPNTPAFPRRPSNLIREEAVLYKAIMEAARKDAGSISDVNRPNKRARPDTPPHEGNELAGISSIAASKRPATYPKGGVRIPPPLSLGAFGFTTNSFLTPRNFMVTNPTTPTRPNQSLASPFNGPSPTALGSFIPRCLDAGRTGEDDRQQPPPSPHLRSEDYAPAQGRHLEVDPSLEEGQIRDEGVPLCRDGNRGSGGTAPTPHPVRAAYAPNTPRTPTNEWTRTTRGARKYRLPSRPPTPGPSRISNRFAVLPEDECLPSWPVTPTPMATHPLSTPEGTGGLPPSLVNATFDFLSQFTKLQRMAVVDAYEKGIICGPDASKKDTVDFWPDARDFVVANWNLLEEAVDAGPVDQEMVDDNQLPAIPEELGPVEEVFEEVDIQNLIVTPCAVPNGGRFTNQPFPLPRPHLHGAASIQPPIQASHYREPDAGFPKIRRDDPEALVAGGDPKKIISLSLANPETTCIVEPFNYSGVKQGEGWKMARNVVALFEELFDAKGVIAIPAEIPEPRPRFNRDDIHTRTPRFLVVKGVPPDAQRMATAQQTWGTKNIAVNVFPAVLRHDDYLGRIEGFVHDTNKAITTLLTAKFSADDVRAIICKYVRVNPHRNHDTEDVATQKILNSLRIDVQEIEPDKKLVAHVCLDTPADTIEASREWKKEMKGLRWDNDDNGTGVWVNEQPCRICNSADHVHADCPFTRLTSWISPPLLEKPRTDREDGRGGGFRGRLGPRGGNGARGGYRG
ncbi:hypothetical protein LXA43DRAFT_1069693 [Ganoderma leucocontextum]|nr:hypothetical protein LXA43DRAFT_1069693 [Ganoderma leucocontextum]